MPGETVKLNTEPRPSALASILRRVPFTLLLRGCSTTEIQTEAPTVRVPRTYKLKARDGEVLLRYYGAPSSPTWSVKARMEDANDGVQLTGHLRGVIDRCYFWLFALMTMVSVGATVATGIGHGLGNSAFLGGVIVSLLLCGVTLVLLLLHPGVLAKREEIAKKMLRDAFETGEGPEERRPVPGVAGRSRHHRMGP